MKEDSQPAANLLLEVGRMSDPRDPFANAFWMPLPPRFIVRLPAIDWENTVVFHGKVDADGAVEILHHVADAPTRLIGRTGTTMHLTLPPEAAGCDIVLRRKSSGLRLAWAPPPSEGPHGE